MNSYRRLRTAPLSLLLAILAVAASPISTVTAQTPDGLALGRVDVGDFPRVEFDVSIPTGLTDGPVGADDVTLLENGQPVPITTVPVPTDGLEVVLLLDTSGSMNENNAIGSAKLAAVSFLDELPVEVPVGVVAFSDSPALVSPLTTDREALRGAIGQLRASGRTSLYDGIVFGNSLFSGATDDRQFVLLSDGGDTASLSTLEDALAITTDVRTNAIEIVTSESNTEALSQLASSGNGRLTSITDPTALGELYQEIARSLVDRYRISFTSQSSGPTDYVLTVNSVFGPLSASTFVDLSAVAATTTTATTTAPSTTTAPAPTTTPAENTVATSTVAEANVPQEKSSGPSNSTIPLVLGGLAVGVSLTTLLVIALTGDRRRIGRLQLGVDRRRKARGESTSIGYRVTALADEAIDRSGSRSGLANLLDVADVSMRPAEYVVVAVAAAISIGALMWVLVGPLLGLLGLVAALLGARSYLTIRAERRRAAFEQQLPDVLQLMTNALRSGFALPQALDAVANQAAEPARTEFERVNFESRVGLDLGDSLSAVADRMQSKTFGWVVSALDINREVGGELAKVLSSLATSIRERQALDRQIKTLTADGRISAYVLTGLPIILGVVIALLNPEYFEPMRTSPGPQILVGCVVLLGIGWIWMRAMIRTEL